MNHEGVSYFVNSRQAPKLIQMQGLKTTILTGLHGEKMMMALNATLPGHTVPEHTHPHEQTGMVYSGRARLRIMDEERIVQKGDFYCIPSNVPHSDTCIGDEPFVMLDVFFPVRKDLIEKLQGQAPVPPVEIKNVDEYVCVFVEGTILDDRHRLRLPNLGFDRLDLVKQDRPVGGAVETLNRISTKYKVLYLSTRKAELHELTKEWIRINGFPDGEVYFGETLEERLALVKKLRTERKIVAGIGDRWDDNQLHLEIGCLSIILKEYEGNWKTVEKYLLA